MIDQQWINFQATKAHCECQLLSSDSFLKRHLSQKPDLFFQFECIQIIIVLFPRGDKSLLFTEVATFNIGLRFNF